MDNIKMSVTVYGSGNRPAVVSCEHGKWTLRFHKDGGDPGLSGRL